VAHIGVRHLWSSIPHWVIGACQITFGLAVVQATVRAQASAQIYGYVLAVGAPFRIVWGNLVNFAATAAALRQFAAAQLKGRVPTWHKTEHIYPVPRLGEVLVRMNLVSMRELRQALKSVPEGVFIGQHLVHLQIVSVEHVHQALNFQKEQATPIEQTF
jgi:hypothetical protein